MVEVVTDVLANPNPNPNAPPHQVRPMVEVVTDVLGSSTRFRALHTLVANPTKACEQLMAKLAQLPPPPPAGDEATPWHRLSGYVSSVAGRLSDGARGSHVSGHPPPGRDSAATREMAGVAAEAQAARLSACGRPRGALLASRRVGAGGAPLGRHQREALALPPGAAAQDARPAPLRPRRGLRRHGRYHALGLHLAPPHAPLGRAVLGAARDDGVRAVRRDRGVDRARRRREGDRHRRRRRLPDDAQRARRRDPAGRHVRDMSGTCP